MATRILDFGKSGKFHGIFGRPRTLAWPVHAYRITMPTGNKSAHEQLNPFERVILNLLGVVGGVEEDALAKETCIPIDLVRNVIFRLRDRGLIDQDNQIKKASRAASSASACEDQYVTALTFRELVGGRVLPIVQVLDDGIALKATAVDGRFTVLQQSNEWTHGKQPTAREVIDAISQMERRSGRTQALPLNDQVRIGRDPEEYLLECEIVIQMHDADFRIANPFGEGFSRVLERAFTRRLSEDQKLQQWMMEWRRNLGATNIERGARTRVPAPFDTPETRMRYRKLVELLKPSRGETHRSLSSIYHSLEWALFYTCRSYDTEIAIRRLSLETERDYSRWMSDVACSVGFEVPPPGFRPLSKGKLDAFSKRSEADMETVLALCLLQAEKLPEHPLRRVAAGHPDFLVRLRSLKCDRDRLVHGREHARAFSDAPLESDTFLKEVVHALLPSIRFEEGSNTRTSTSQEDRRLEARTSLLETFGHAAFSKLGPSSQQALLSAELFWLVCQDGDDARQFVVDLYSGLQGILFGYLTGVAPSEILEDDYLALAKERANRAGFGHFPPALETVNLRRIRETLFGNDQTLGASACALLLKASEEFLGRLAQSDPDFLATVASLHVTRKHGNEPTPLLKDEVNKLRRSTLASIDALLTNED